MAGVRAGYLLPVGAASARQASVSARKTGLRLALDEDCPFQ